MLTTDTTICAVSSPAGSGPRGIVRLSGSRAVAIAAEVFQPHDARPLSETPTYRSAEGEVRLPGFAAAAPATLYLMRAPRSYTREDVVELHVPGNAALLEATLTALLERGARLAEPGEFTRRAFLHGRIDLTQAEAVAAVIQSNTRSELRVAMQQARGEFGRRVAAAREQIVDLLAEIEADLDFSDQEIELLSDEQVLARLADCARAVERLLAGEASAAIRRDAARVAICGRPNVGKSSLLNRLLGRRRSIESPTPGATRDLIDDLVEIDGVQFVLTDTPGLGGPSAGLDRQAMRQGEAAIGQAQIVLLVADRSQGVLDEDVAIRQSLADSVVVAVLNKSDLPAAVEPEAAAALLRAPAVAVSCRTGEGLDELRRALADAITSPRVDLSASLAIANARHRQELQECLRALRRAQRALEHAAGRELAAIDLRDAGERLARVLGVEMDAPEEILDRVFSQFCIGK